MSKKIGAVISGGGAFGAFGAGTLAALDRDYEAVAGISTGALMAPMVALREWDVLKEAYTSVTQRDIVDYKWYKPQPLTKKGSINFWAILYALIFKQKTLGTTKALKRTIDKFLTEEYYGRVKNQNKNVIVGCQNLNQNPSRIHYFDLLDETFEDFKDWMWASANASFLTSILEKEWELNGEKYLGQWIDGGISELIALDVLNDMNCDEIDVIIHRPFPKDDYQLEPFDTFIENVNRNIAAMRYDIEFEFFMYRAKEFAKQGTKLNLYWLPRKLGNHFLLFYKNKMTEWWNEGYETAHDTSRIIILDPKNFK
ncbi:MAG: patatin-like phospholipase family protein [bacterium]